MKFFSFFWKILDKILIFFLVNKKCLGCKKVLNKEDIFNKNFVGNCCWKNIKETIPISINFNKQKVKIYSLGVYYGFLKKILHSKYYGNHFLYDLMGKKISDYILNNNIKFDFIIPIPQHFIRKISREFNQTELLAKSISTHTGIPALYDVLFFKKYKIEQNKIKKEEKLFSSKDIFLVKNNEVLENKNICIIDDIYTTGYTIKSAIRSFRIKNYNSCSVFVVARCKK